MLDRVLTYVRAVLAGEKKGDPAIGRYLMDTLGASTEDLEKGGFNTSLQVRGRPMIFIEKAIKSIFSAGHIDDFLPCKPCQGSSRSLVQIGPYSRIIDVCNLWNFVIFFFPSASGINAVRWVWPSNC